MATAVISSETRVAKPRAARWQDSRFRALVEGISDVVTVIGRDGKIFYVSPSVERMGGYTPDELVGTNWFSLLHPDSVEPCAQALRQLERTPAEPVTSVLTCRRQDGSWCVVECVSRDFANDPGIGGIVVTLRDITVDVAQRESIERLSRTRAMSLAIHALIVRARSQTELLQDAARIAVESGGFAGACAALVHGERLKPVGWHGLPAEAIDPLLYPLGAQCDAVQAALETQRPAQCGNVASDGPALARGLGMRSSAVVPLVLGGHPIGVLAFWSREPAFTAGEMELLADLGGVISHALEYIAHEDQLDYLAIYDPLTRLPNRGLFLKRLQGFLDEAQARGEPVSLLVFDIVQFLALNEKLGRQTGDKILRQVGERIKAAAGGPSFVGRIAGDIFAVVLPGADEDAQATILGTEAWRALEAPFEVAGREQRLIFTIGSAVQPPEGGTAEALLASAKFALKHGKTRGERWVHYRPELRAGAERRLVVEERLHGALRRGEFSVHYQPKVSVKTQQVVGFEALLRWDNPVLGRVPPSEFVPLLEASGLIEPVGLWVMRTALRDRADWLSRGLAVLPVAVNVSPVQLQSPSFVRQVTHLLGGAHESGLEIEVTESGLDVEISESAVAAGDARTAEKLAALRALGMRISIDDFGTGYSALAKLPQFPLHALKIDRSFVSRMTEDSFPIVSAVLALARSMDLRVIAEGVETQEQLKLLRLLHCDEFQGYLFSPAVPAERVPEFLKAVAKPPARRAKALMA